MKIRHLNGAFLFTYLFDLIQSEANNFYNFHRGVEREARIEANGAS